MLYSHFNINQQDQIKKQANTHRTYYTIEGNIGCGKSTFLSILQDKLSGVQWIPEPVSQWQQVGGRMENNILDRYYKQPNRWAFTFQIYAIFTRIKALQQAQQNHPDKKIILQRSILADKHVFSQLMTDLGYLDQTQSSIFKTMYPEFQKTTHTQNLKIIYLKCSPQKCHLRTKQRNRGQQEQISLEYLELIHEKHQKWMAGVDEGKVLVIDTNEDFKGDQEKIEEILGRLREFMDE